MNNNGAAPRGGPKQQDPNNVSMLSIVKQTRMFVERLRYISEESGERIF